MASSEKKVMAKEGPPKEPETLIYCGPNLPQGQLNQFTAYRGGVPKHLEKHIEKCPAIRRLFVLPDRLNQVLQAIKTAGTPENVWFKEVETYIRGGMKE